MNSDNNKITESVMRTPLYILAIVAVLTTIGWIYTMSMSIKPPATPNRCPFAKVDTIYNMVTDKKWEVNDNLPPMTDVSGCVIPQEIVYLKYWSPIINHSEL